MNCKVCGKPVVLVPSAKERARKFGGKPSDYTNLFPVHADCQLAMRSVPAAYSRPVRTLADAQALFAELHASGKMFHPDDAPHTVVYAARGGRLFTDAEAAALAERMKEVRALDWSAWNDGEHPECPCGYLMQTYPLGE